MTDARRAGERPEAKAWRDFEVRNEYGLHARPSALIAKTASRFDSEVYLERGGRRVSAKSIMALLTLAAGKGARIRVSAEGTDAEDAVAEVGRLFESKFAKTGEAADD